MLAFHHTGYWNLSTAHDHGAHELLTFDKKQCALGRPKGGSITMIALLDLPWTHAKASTHCSHPQYRGTPAALYKHEIEVVWVHYGRTRVSLRVLVRLT